jgi:hydroxyacylglutathione hydrolase
MKHVVTQPTPPFQTADGRLEIHQVPAWADNLVWLLVCRETGDAAVVDGPDAGPTLEYCQRMGIRLTMVLNTHTHFDHIGINKDLERRNRLAHMRVFGPRLKAKEIPGLTDPVDEGDEIRLGETVGRVMRTEGHIDGHISFLFGDAVFCGDTMFAGGCGYLFDGPPAKMHHSLQRLAGLPPETRVCCAHEYTEDNLRFAWMLEPDNEALADRIRHVWALREEGRCTVPSTIAEEVATNPFLRLRSPTLLSNVRARMPDADLDTDVEIFAAVRKLKDRKDHRALGDTALPIAS